MKIGADIRHREQGWGRQGRPARRLTRAVVRLLSAALIFLPAAVAAESLKIGGTGTDLGTMNLLAAEFQGRHPEVSIDILPSMGTGGGIKAVLAGAIDIGLISRPLKQDERQAGAHERIYARTALVVGVGADNPRDAITKGELIDFVSGKKNVWPDGRRVRVILRNEGETDLDFLKKAVAGMDSALQTAYRRQGTVITYTDQENADHMERVPDALGITSLSVILGERRRLKALALDGAAPTLDAISDGTWPMIKTLYFVTRGAPGGWPGRFIEFVRSAESATLLRETGHVPLNAINRR